MSVCRNCGAENAPGQKFCGECGTALAAVCSSCGAANQPGQKFCGECGTPLQAASPAIDGSPPATSAAPAAERRLVSVLFLDLVGFTAASEGRDSEDTRELLTSYFDLARTLITRYGGTIEKFIGDAVMAVWGTPVATETDAERAVRAALELVASIPGLDPALQARAGVLTGEAAVTIGAEGQGMVAGDLVNTASRIQSAAEPGTVLVGEVTRRATEQAIVYESAGEHELKGKAEPVALWRALRVVSGLSGQLKSAGLEAPFVGRERELKLCKELFHGCAEERRAHLVSVTGIAGIGKSRLAWEFYKYFDGIVEQVYWHRGRCLAYGEGVAYWALADMVRMRCRIGEDEAAGVRAREARGDARGALPRQGRARLRRAAAGAAARARRGRDRRPAGPLRRLAAVLRAAGRHLPDRARLRGHAVGRHEPARLRRVPARVVAQLPAVRRSRSRGRSCRSAGRAGAPASATSPRSTWSRSRGRRWRSCSKGSCRACRRACATRSSRARRACRCTRSRRCGCCSTAACSPRRGRSTSPTGEIETLEVPETLHALIAARLDGVSPEERRLLQDGAVLGKTFTVQALAALSGTAPAELEPLLASLVRKEVLGVQSDPRSPERGQYGFLQDLVRHVAYETLSKRERKTRHLAAAEHLQTVFADEDELAEVLASHYLAAFEAAAEADDAPAIRAKAREMLARAGERAGSLGAPEEGQRYYDQAAALADEPLLEAKLLEQAGGRRSGRTSRPRHGNGSSARSTLYAEADDAERGRPRHRRARRADCRRGPARRRGRPARAGGRAARAGCARPRAGGGARPARPRCAPSSGHGEDARRARSSARSPWPSGCSCPRSSSRRSRSKAVAC